MARQRAKVDLTAPPPSLTADEASTPVLTADGTDAGKAPPAPVPLPLWSVSGVYGHAERLVEAASEDAAWAEYQRQDGLLGSDHRPKITKVVSDAAPVGP